MSIKLGSLFDGSGGFPLAGAISGIEPVWAAEVEPYPIAVTRSRFPQMEHLGSVTEVHGDKVQPVDVITFGSPCQDLSVAGKRAGIHDGQRSNLFFEAVRIIKEMRDATNGRHPTFAVWENVPGAFSSNKGADFRCVLEAFVRISAEISVPGPANGRWNPAGEIVGDGFSIAWRQLDAQYWGVPQRRKRIYLVADFRGGRAGEILFERESMRGNPTACGAPERDAAANAAGSAAGSAGELIQPCVCNESGQGYWMPGLGCLRAEGENRPSRPSHLVCFAQNQRNEVRDLGKHSGALCAADWRGPNSQYVGADKLICTDARGNGNGHVCANVTGDHENRVTDYTNIITYGGDKAGTLDASYYKGAGARNGKEREFVAERKAGRKYIVRRLTPLECCRLQGFPDGWGVPDRKDRLTNEELEFWQGVRDTCASIAGKPPKKYSAKSLTRWYNALHTDSAEYKMWGNGIALPCAAFVLGNVANVIRENVE